MLYILPIFVNRYDQIYANDALVLLGLFLMDHVYSITLQLYYCSVIILRHGRINNNL